MRRPTAPNRGPAGPSLSQTVGEIHAHFLGVNSVTLMEAVASQTVHLVAEEVIFTVSVHPDDSVLSSRKVAVAYPSCRDVGTSPVSRAGHVPLQVKAIALLAPGTKYFPVKPPTARASPT